MAVTEPVPARVDAAAKAGLLTLVDHAVDQGWTLQAVCEVLRISRRGLSGGTTGAATWSTGSRAGWR